MIQPQTELFARTISEADRSGELSKLIASYRVIMNQLTGRLLYLERQFRRAGDEATQSVATFCDQFLESCSKIPDKPAEWDGANAYGSSHVFILAREMYYAARDLRSVAKKIVTVRRHFYRDLKTLDERHKLGMLAFVKGGLLLEDRRAFTMVEREAIWKRCERICRYCRKSLFSFTGEFMHIDHITPVILGGNDELDNLCAACPACNLKKGAKNEEAFLAALLTGQSSVITDGVNIGDTPKLEKATPELENEVDEVE